jgi:hypothetical protein
VGKTTITMQRRGQRLECTSPAWADLLDEFPQGVDLNVAVTRARSQRQNGTYWGALAWLITDGPERIGKTWLTKDELSDALQLEVGFVRQIKLANGLTYAVPRSKNFEECSQEVFNAYFDAAQVKLEEWCGYDAVSAYLEHMASRRKAA